MKESVKLTFNPSKESVLGRLGQALKETQETIDIVTKELDALGDPDAPGKLYNPAAENDRRNLKNQLFGAKKQEESLQDLISLIESSTGPLQAEAEISS
jgi:hypothetical protein